LVFQAAAAVSSNAAAARREDLGDVRGHVGGEHRGEGGLGAGDLDDRVTTPYRVPPLLEVADQRQEREAAQPFAEALALRGHRRGVPRRPLPSLP
jgi:hypothetical protein